MAADIGQGTAIAFGSTNWTAEIINAVGFGLSRDSIETTHSTTTGGKTYIANDVYEPGELTFDINFDASQATDPPVSTTTAAETITVKWAGNTAHEWTASGFMTNYELTGSLEDRMTASITYKLSGSLGFEPA